MCGCKMNKTIFFCRVRSAAVCGRGSGLHLELAETNPDPLGAVQRQDAFHSEDSLSRDTRTELLQHSYQETQRASR